MFLSSLEDVRNKAMGFEVGGNDCLTKPFEVLEVEARVPSILKVKAYSYAVKGNVASELRRLPCSYRWIAIATVLALRCRIVTAKPPFPTGLTAWPSSDPENPSRRGNGAAWRRTSSGGA